MNLSNAQEIIQLNYLVVLKLTYEGSTVCRDKMCSFWRPVTSFQIKNMQ